MNLDRQYEEEVVFLPAQVREIVNFAMEALSPFQDFINDTQRDVMTIPSHLVAFQDLLDAFASFSEVIPSLEYDSVMRRFVFAREQLDNLERTMPEIRTDPIWQRAASGQLMISIDTDTLCELVELEFSDSTIAVMLGTSVSTIERRRRALGLTKRGGSSVSDTDLHMAIRSTYALGMDAGERGMRGALRTIGVQVSRARLRLALQEIDPLRVQARWAKTIQRRVYYVPFVNSLWHIDGHHKLIKYKIVIHGGVDGKSRAVTFMQANANNRAETVTGCFLEATARWGWPSRVRADHLGVQQLMEQRRGTGRGSFIQGPSTRNQRIERMWADVQRWTTAKYKGLFEAMEACGLLDVTSPIHLWCLHLVFLPQLNLALQHFQDVWNCHPIRTANHNWSPQQMHTSGMLEAERKGFDLRADVQVLELGEDGAEEHLRQHALRNFADYGNDIPSRGRMRRDDDPHVAVDPVERGVPPELLVPEVRAWLEEQVPLEWPPREELGMERYSRVMDLVVTLLTNAV